MYGFPSVLCNRNIRIYFFYLDYRIMTILDAQYNCTLFARTKVAISLNLAMDVRGGNIIKDEYLVKTPFEIF